jgi:hypothetical protein
MAEFNIVGPKFDPTCDHRLFTSVEEDKNGILPELTPLVESDRTLAHLLARLGKFQSVSEAKRNGWDKPIPFGWSVFTIGKAAKRWDLFIWNPDQTLEEFHGSAGHK